MKDWFDQVLPLRNVCGLHEKVQSRISFALLKKIFIYYTESSRLVQGWSARWHSTGSEHWGKWISWSYKIQGHRLKKQFSNYTKQTITRKKCARIPPHMHIQNPPIQKGKTKAPKLVFSHCFRFLLSILGDEFPTVTALGLCRWAVWVCVGSSKNPPSSWFCEFSLLVFCCYVYVP